MIAIYSKYGHRVDLMVMFNCQSNNLSHVAVMKRLDRILSAEKPQPGEDGRIDTEQYPALHKTILKIDDILSDIQRQIVKPISIETPGGWKIDR